MGSTASMLEESILATQQQKSAADQVATAMVQIRESADQLAAEQEQRVGTAERVDELVGSLEQAPHRQRATNGDGTGRRERRARATARRRARRTPSASSTCSRWPSSARSRRSPAPPAVVLGVRNLRGQVLPGLRPRVRPRHRAATALHDASLVVEHDGSTCGLRDRRGRRRRRARRAVRAGRVGVPDGAPRSTTASSSEWSTSRGSSRAWRGARHDRSPRPSSSSMFRDEANERLDNMVDTLLALESGRAGPDALDSLFRDAHTIKGGAGMLGLDERRHARARDRGRPRRARAKRESSRSSSPIRCFARPTRCASTSPAKASRRPICSRSSPRSRAGADAGDAPARRALPAPVAGAPAAVPAERRAIRVPAAEDRPAARPRRRDRAAPAAARARPRRRAHRAATRTSPTSSISASGCVDELKDAAIEMRTLPISTITAALPRAVRDIAAAEGQGGRAGRRAARAPSSTASSSRASPSRSSISCETRSAHGVETPGRARARRQAGARDGRAPRRAARRHGRDRRLRRRARRVEGDPRARPRRTAPSPTSSRGRASRPRRRSPSSPAAASGLDAVKRHVESFGGTLEVCSEPGKGTRIVLVLPLALALLDVLLVERGGQAFGLPLAAVEEVARPSRAR